MQTELDLRDKEAGDGADALKQQVKAANRSRRSYRDFLRRFCVLREEVKLDPDEFDLNFYTYGLSVYGNLPLIEPLESRESKKIEELALVIDTSYSTSGELVRAFLAETYTLLKGQENFFHRMNLHLIQADNAIRQDILIHNEDELIHAMNHFELRGFAPRRSSRTCGAFCTSPTAWAPTPPSARPTTPLFCFWGSGSTMPMYRRGP